MPKTVPPKSPSQIEKLDHPGGTHTAIFPVGGVKGLALHITPKGKRTWKLRISEDGKDRHLEIGGYPEIDVYEAREMASDTRKRIKAKKFSEEVVCNALEVKGRSSVTFDDETPSVTRKPPHSPSLAVEDAPAWFHDLRCRKGVSARALEFLVLTLASSSDVRKAFIMGFDASAAQWRRLSSDGLYRATSLSPQAIDVLSRTERIYGNPLLFPGPSGRVISDAAFAGIMARINRAREGGYLDPDSGLPAVPSGLRRTFLNWVHQRSDQSLEDADAVLTEAMPIPAPSGPFLTQNRYFRLLNAWGTYLSEGS